MSGQASNVHATAIVLGRLGFLIVGPSGAGKTALGISLISGARNRGYHAALVSDDQVLVSVMNGRIVAKRPATIAGLAEVRGAGIVAMESVASAVLDFALTPVARPYEPRLPPEKEEFIVNARTRLPLLRIPVGDSWNPFEILRLMLPENAKFQG